MLKPASMQRIAVLGLKEERRKVVSILYDLGAVQVEPLSTSAAQFLRTGGDAAGTRDVSEELLRIRSLKSALPPVAVGEKRGFSSLGELFEVSRSIRIDDDVAKLKQEEDNLNLRLDELRDRIDLVSKLSFIDADLSVFDLKSAASFFGVVPAQAHQALMGELAPIKEAIAYSTGKDPVSVVVVIPNSALEEFGAIIQKSDLRLQRIPPLKGKPTEVLSRLQEEQSTDEAELKKARDGLQALSVQNYGLISLVEEQLSIEALKLDVVNSFGFTDSSFVLEGWVPSRRLSNLEEILSRHARSIQVFRIEGEDRPPTLLENPKRLKFFESFIRFYSTPESDEFDPTIIFSLLFPIFFGFMLGDVGYGIAIILISVWIIRRVNHPERRTLVPRGLRSFASTILKPAQYKKLAMAMILGSLVGIVMGFILNAYFGFPLNQYLFSYLNASFHLGLPANGTFLDPTSTGGLKTLLLYSGYVGLFTVSLGLVLGMLNAYWVRERKHLVGKIGWLSVAWGIALFGLTLLHRGDTNPASNPIVGSYVGMIVAGILLIVYGEGVQAIVEFPSIISHIISYTRLLGILLASFVLAFVIDKVVVGAVSGAQFTATGVALAIGGIILLVGGQSFNLVLGILEPGIQGARLNYVEFFSKFYHGGGKSFAPFKGKRTFTTSEIDLFEPRSAASTAETIAPTSEALKPVPQAA